MLTVCGQHTKQQHSRRRGRGKVRGGGKDRQEEGRGKAGKEGRVDRRKAGGRQEGGRGMQGRREE